MIEIIRKDKAVTVVNKYYKLLAATGYVKRASVRRLIIYLFIINLIDWTFPYISDGDYVAIDKALVRLFSEGGCLFPYSILPFDGKMIHMLKLGESYYTGLAGVIRETEAGALRATEDKNNQRASV